MLVTRKLSTCHHTKRCMGETIPYLALIKQQQPRYLLQMITIIDTTSSETQPTKLLSLPEFGLPGPRLREEYHALWYPLEDRYWSLETCSLQNQDN